MIWFLIAWFVSGAAILPAAYWISERRKNPPLLEIAKIAALGAFVGPTAGIACLCIVVLVRE